MSKDEKKSIHDPCPYGNDECPMCTKDRYQEKCEHTYRKKGFLCTKCRAHLPFGPVPSPISEEWRKRFEEKFNSGDFRLWSGVQKELKDFISKLLLEARSAEREEILREVKNIVCKDCYKEIERRI